MNPTRPKIRTGVRGAWLLAAALALLPTAGCEPRQPSAREILAFQQAGPAPIPVDQSRLTPAPCRAGPYVLCQGDLIALQMPEVLAALYPDMPSNALMEPVRCRVRNGGTIQLPLGGEVPARGKTLEELESLVAQAYCPKVVSRSPSVTAQVLEHRLVQVAVTGAVAKPGVYELRGDELSLLGLLNKAGNITEGGAYSVCVRGTDAGGRPRCLILPVTGMNVPYANVALAGGDEVEVRRLDPEVFTVIGLVRRPGVFPYPGDAQFNLVQAMGFAGGLDQITDPQHITIYRKDASGQVVRLKLRIAGKELRQNANFPIKPGDALVVEHTLRTRVRQAFAAMFRGGFWLGATYDFSDD